MAANIKGITIEIDGNVTPLQKALSSVNKSIKDTQKQLKDVDKLLKLDPKNTELLRQKQELLSNKVKDVKDKLDKEKQALAQLAQGDQTPEVKAKMAELEKQIAQDESALKSATKELKNFGSVGKQEAQATAEEFKAAGKKISEVGGQIKGVGDQLTQKVTAPIVAAATASGYLASGFEDSMAKVSTIADTDSVPLSDLEDQIKSLSDETGIGASEIAENVYNAISAGQKTGDAVNFVGEASKLARAGFAESGDALDILTTILNAYGMEAEKVTDVSDILINTQNLGKTTVGELSSAMGKVIPTAKAQGVGLEGLASAYAVMTSNGIATAESTTYLNSMLNELGKDGTTASDAFRLVTRNVQDGGLSFKEAMEQGWTLTDVLGVLNEAAYEDGTTIANMFGSAEAGKAATVLADNTEKYTESLEAMGECAGATDEAFGKLDTTSYRAQKALNEMKNLGIEVGTVILENLTPAIEKAKSVIEDLKAKWDELSPGAQDAILTAAAVAAVIGPIVAIIGSIVTGIGGLITAVGVVAGALGVAASTVGIVIGVIVALGAAIVVLITHWDDIKKKVKEVWENIKKYTSDLKANVTQKWDELKNGIINKVANVKTDMANKWSAIKSDAVNKATGIKTDVTNRIGELKTNVVNKLAELKTSAGDKLDGIKQKFVDKFDAIKEKVSGFIDKIKGFFDNLTLKVPTPSLPKLPHFSLETNTKTILGQTITYPTGFSVDWWAKAMNNPYLFTSPTVFGAGEAGHEMMYGHDSLMRDITEASARNNAALINGFYNAMSAALKDNPQTIQIGRREFSRIVREASV